MKTLFKLYENISDDTASVVLNLLETREDISYCKAAVDRKPSRYRKKYWIVEHSFIDDKEDVNRRVYMTYQRSTFKEEESDQSREIVILT